MSKKSHNHEYYPHIHFTVPKFSEINILWKFWLDDFKYHFSEAILNFGAITSLNIKFTFIVLHRIAFIKLSLTQKAHWHSRCRKPHTVSFIFMPKWPGFKNSIGFLDPTFTKVSWENGSLPAGRDMQMQLWRRKEIDFYKSKGKSGRSKLKLKVAPKVLYQIFVRSASTSE